MSTDIEPSGNNSPEIYDQQGNQLTPTPPKIDLRDAAAIRRELGSVYRDMRSGRIDPADGTKLAYVLDAIRKAYDSEILQARLEILERTLRK
jgi:hypothetical protein